MFNKFIRWLVWSVGGLLLIGLIVLHFTRVWVMPDYLILTIGICFGMYLLMFLDTLTEEFVKSKRSRNE